MRAAALGRNGAGPTTMQGRDSTEPRRHEAATTWGSDDAGSYDSTEPRRRGANDGTRPRQHGVATLKSVPC